MDFETTLKLAIYQRIARTASLPSAPEMAAELDLPEAETRAGFQRLRERRVLVLEADGDRILMAPPFSGVATQHVVRVDGKRHFANCAWDALGVPACLHRPAEVESRCEQSLEPIRFHVGESGPAPEPCVVHFAVPAAQWWKDIVFT